MKIMKLIYTLIRMEKYFKCSQLSNVGNSDIQLEISYLPIGNKQRGLIFWKEFVLIPEVKNTYLFLDIPIIFT